MKIRIVSTHCVRVVADGREVAVAYGDNEIQLPKKVSHLELQVGGRGLWDPEFTIVDPLPAVLAGRWSKREEARARRRFPGCVIVRHRFGRRSARKG